MSVMTEVEQDAEIVEDAVHPSVSRGRLRWLRRRDRKGALGSVEMLKVIAVIAIVAVLGGGSYAAIRAIFGTSENTVVQNNIDQVVQLADGYWENYAADTDGRKKIDVAGFCRYVNNQLGEDDLNLRTLQIVTAANANMTPTAIGAARDATSGDGIETAGGVTVQAGNISDAACAAGDGSNITGTFHNIRATDDRATGTTVDAHKTALENAGLLSTKTVWIAQYGDGSTMNLAPAGTCPAASAGTAHSHDSTTCHAATDTPSGGTAHLHTGGWQSAAGYVFSPDGSDTTFANGSPGVEVLVFGGMAPSGDSFCVIKVFDAADADQIGEYRVARITNDNLEFATCLAGFQGAWPNNPVHGNEWPEPKGVS